MTVSFEKHVLKAEAKNAPNVFEPTIDDTLYVFVPLGHISTGQWKWWLFA